MIIQTEEQLRAYREAGRISTEIMAELRDTLKAGVFPIELDKLAGELCSKYSVRPSFKGVKQSGKTYHHNSCISVNDEILHGIPSDTRSLQTGDIVKVDFGIVHQSLHTDHCFSVAIEKASEKDLRLLQVGREAVLKAVDQAVTGARTGDLGFVMQKTATRAGFDVLKQYIGHGIGTTLHDDPEIPAWGKKGRGQLLQKNMVICVEAQVVAGSDEIYTDTNGWTIKSTDGSNGVMFEYMVRVDDEPEILTDTVDWQLVV